MFGLVKIRDDRGAIKSLYEEPWAIRNREKVLSQAFREAIQFQHGRKFRRADVAWVLLGSLGPSVGILAVRPWVERVTSSVAMGYVVFFAFVGVWAAMAGTMNVYAARLRVRTALLRFGRCASCGYALSELQVEDDGCVVCTECGGAWRREGW